MDLVEPVTLRHVAEEAGVSIDTVSRVLNGKGKEKWPSAMKRAKEIRAIAERLNYRPNAAARAIRTSRTRVIGALVRNNPRDRHIHPLAFETLLGINEGLEAAGYVLSIIRYDDVQLEQSKGSRVFQEHVVDGMFAMETLSPFVMERVEQLVPTCVWVNTNVWRPDSCIRRDELQAGELVARKLIELGYKRLVMVGGTRGSTPHYSHNDRFVGLRNAAERAGASADRVELPWAPTFSVGKFPIELITPETAFVAEGTYWAHWLAHVAAGLGKTPAYDYGLACCDESSEIRRYWPGLSRATFDHYEMGLLAARMLLERLGEGGSVSSSRKFASSWKPGNTAWGPISFR